MVFPTGSLSVDELRAIVATLPVDLTFVDTDDRVRFFTEGRDRVFARPKAIVGRLVHHCHPPASVHVVDRILKDFREGRQSVADFWIDFRGRFVRIRYFAVRDDRGTYLGTLEVTERVATLEQAAAIGGVSSRDLVTALRRAAGQPIDDPAPEPSSPGPGGDDGPLPAWVDPARVRRVVDADAILATGAAPLATVFEAARALDGDDLLEVSVSFRPVPLVESLGKQGYACHVRAAAGRFHVYVKK